MGFMKKMTEVLNNETSVTENGALGYKTTGKKLLDINFSTSSLRKRKEEEIVFKFLEAFYEDKMLAVKWLFFASDVRGGMGERRLFRICMKYLAEEYPEIAKAVLSLIPEYSRWDNLICLVDTPLAEDVVEIIKTQLLADIQNANQNKPISLLAKWMPSANTSSSKTKNLAKKLIKLFGCTDREYRKILSGLRRYLDVVEVKMSSGNWSEIEYSAVPSKANVMYNSAFLKHDEKRRRDYLESLSKGETKINSSVLFPYDIVNKYKSYPRKDIALEKMWESLPDYVNGNGSTICVADGSGSMGQCVSSGSRVTCLDVANSLAIYFAERCSGEFKDKYITFSMNPRLVNLSVVSSLREKLNIAYRYNEMANTNIEAVFDLILDTAIKYQMQQEEIPSNILILSDMEFDGCARMSSDRHNYGGKVDEKLFEHFANKYEQNGYKLPRLIFWNICSRTNTIPLKENALGVALVSGFSPAIMNMVLSNKTDPYECLIEQLSVPRYDKVENAIKDFVA